MARQKFRDILGNHVAVAEKRRADLVFEIGVKIHVRALRIYQHLPGAVLDEKGNEQPLVRHRLPVPIFARAFHLRCERAIVEASLARNPNASHPINAILNYAYGVLQSHVQIRLVSEGYDPMLGIMHYDREGAPAFVFDMMEPERPKVDRAVLAFLKSEALHPADFTIREDGVVRLNPELARRLVKITTTAS